MGRTTIKRSRSTTCGGVPSPLPRPPHGAKGVVGYALMVGLILGLNPRNCSATLRGEREINSQ